MKKFCFIFLGLFFASLANGQEQYYYSYKFRIPLQETEWILLIQENEDTTDSLNIETHLFETNRRTYSLVNKGDAADFTAHKNFPVYQTNDGFLLSYTDEIVLSLKNEENLPSVLQQYSLELIKSCPVYTLVRVLNHSMPQDALCVANQIQESGLAVFSHPNFISKVNKLNDTVRDTYFNYQFYLHSYGQLINDGHYAMRDADINALEAWSITKGTPNVKVAVIDEGVTSNHPDLPNSRQHRYMGSNFAAIFDGTDADDPSPVGNGNHGNACAGIIAASHNEEGIAGIAPECMIMPIRVPFGSYPSNIYADAIEFAVDNGADVISNSWGYSSSNPNLFPVIVNMIRYATTQGRNGKGCIVTFSAGNTANRILGKTGYVNFPASCLNDTMMVVGASDRNNHVANYSPNSDRMNIVAPSHKAYPSQIPGEDFEVWTIDIPNDEGYNPSAVSGEVLPDFGVNYMSYTGRFGGTSAACPQVAGVSALILSLRPELTAIEVKNIIESTTKKIGGTQYNNNINHPNGTWNNEMGYGLVDAYAAVRKALDSDLYVRDTLSDDGTTPSQVTYMWCSPDIWIEDAAGNVVEHPHGDTDYKVCVKIHNRKETASSGHEKLRLNWVKAGIGTQWPLDWTGETMFDCSGTHVPKGGFIGDFNGVTIPSIPALGSSVVKVPWHTPRAEDYNECSDFGSELWHFCLLARVYDSEEIIGDNLSGCDMGWITIQNNNVAWKNVTLLNSRYNRSVISVANPGTVEQKFKILFKAHPNVKGEYITDFADVYWILDEVLVNLWEEQGKQAENIKEIDRNILKMESYNASLDNMIIPLERHYSLSTSVEFYAKKRPQNDTLCFDIILCDEKGNYVGGEHYKAIRDANRMFSAIAQENQTIFRGEDANFIALDIGETAHYKWYDAQGEKIGEGFGLNVSPQHSQYYVLEVTADADGYKDFDQVSVNVTTGKIEQINPNPATQQVTIVYSLLEETSPCHLEILSQMGQVVLSESVYPTQNQKIIDIHQLQVGYYVVKLVTQDGTVLDAKKLIVQ